MSRPNYVQGHHQSAREARGSRRRHYCQTEVRAGALMSTTVRPTRLRDEDGGGAAAVVKNAQRPTNCNSGPFIILTGSLNNTLYLWSRARQSGIVWEGSQIPTHAEGKRGAARGCTGSFPPPRHQIMRFPQKLKLCRCDFKVRLCFIMRMEVHGTLPPAWKRWPEKITWCFDPEWVN